MKVSSATGTARLLRRVPMTLEARRVGSVVAQAGLAGLRLAVGGVAVPYPRRTPRARLSVQAAHQTRVGFARLGPTYVKLGQLIASSPGVFPDVLSEEFRSMLDRVPPADPALIERTLTVELGGPPDQIFAEFDRTPIASASIAQVHTARLITGEDVVVKIQRPGIRRRLASDVQLLERVASGLELNSYGRMLNAKEIVEDFTQNLNEELDFRGEARAMEEWVDAVSDSQYADRVRVAKVYHEYTTERVLTMERIWATRIDDVDTLNSKGFDSEGLVRTILLSLMDTGFNRGIFHGDLHAGNVLVDDEGRVVFLDFGIVGRFDDRARVILRGMVGDLLVRNDYESASRGLYKLGAVRRPAKVKEAGKLVKDFTDPIARADLSSLSYADLGRQLADLAKRYDTRLPRELVLVGKQLLYVERYMKLLAPKWKAIQDPELFALMARLLARAENERSDEDEVRSSRAAD